MVFIYFTHVARNAMNMALNIQANLWYKSCEMWHYIVTRLTSQQTRTIGARIARIA